MSVETVTAPQTSTLPCDRLGLNDQFTFRCGPDLDCFTHCCRDVTIVLTPYDVLRLKQALGMNSSDFLDQHTLTPSFPNQKFPLVILRMDDETKRCPFVSARGCGVYRDRPWSCRLYPLGTAEPKNPTPDEGAFHFVVIENLCHGHTGGTRRSVREWLEGQGVEEFEVMGASFKDLTLHDFWDKDQELTPEQADMFYMACYDVDRFRRFVFETRFLEMIEVDEARIEAMRTNDEELLEFAIQWLRFSLFRERTMKIRRRAGVETGA
jgi:Fe-S-cluster containining protein